MSTEPVIIGDATLYLGDCADILPPLGPVAIVSDPPYLFETSGGGKFRAERPAMDEIEDEGLADGFDHTLINAERYGHVALFCHNDQLAVLIPYLEAQYGRAPVVCSWHKSAPSPMANKHFLPDTEIWLHCWRDGHAPVKRPGRLGDLKRYWVNANGRQDDYKHRTVKPIDLMRKIVRNVPGELICDPFMGTGTTIAAALIEGRRAIGIERKPEFFAMAVDRVKRVYAQGLARKVVAQ